MENWLRHIKNKLNFERKGHFGLKIFSAYQKKNNSTKSHNKMINMCVPNTTVT